MNEISFFILLMKSKERKKNKIEVKLVDHFNDKNIRRGMRI
jgi:hypothetical protein